MKDYFRILSSEWLKTRRTSLRYITIITPILFTAVILWYFSRFKSGAKLQIDIYEAFFETWSALVIPVGAGLSTGLMIHQEEETGSFNGFLVSSMPRSNMYLGKLFILTLFSLVSTLIATFLLLVGMKYIIAFSILISWKIFVQAALFLELSTLPLLAFHLWISLAYGMGASIGIASAGVIVAAIVGTTNLGNTIWQFVPWAWPARLSSFPGMFLPGIDSIPSILLRNLIQKGLLSVFITFILLMVGGIMWFNRWEGRKIYDS